jgi:hypothetical protein
VNNPQFWFIVSAFSLACCTLPPIVIYRAAKVVGVWHYPALRYLLLICGLYWVPLALYASYWVGAGAFLAGMWGYL